MTFVWPTNNGLIPKDRNNYIKLFPRKFQIVKIDPLILLYKCSFEILTLEWTKHFLRGTKRVFEKKVYIGPMVSYVPILIKLKNLLQKRYLLWL